MDNVLELINNGIMQISQGLREIQLYATIRESQHKKLNSMTKNLEELTKIANEETDRLNGCKIKETSR